MWISAMALPCCRKSLFLAYDTQINHYSISLTIVSYDKKVLEVCELTSTSDSKLPVFTSLWWTRFALLCRVPKVWLSGHTFPFYLLDLGISEYWDLHSHVSGEKWLWTEDVILKSDGSIIGENWWLKRAHLSPDGCRLCKLLHNLYWID